MSALFVVKYDVTNPDLYAQYNPGSIESIMKVVDELGGELVAAGPPQQMQGDAHHVAVALRFPDADTVQQWLDHPDYAEAKAIREASTGNYQTFLIETPQG